MAPRRIAPQARDLAVLDDVDAQGIGGAGIAPGNGIVPRGSTASLQSRSEHGVADVADVQRRAVGFRLLGREPLVVDAACAVGMHMTLAALYIVHRVGEHHHASWREHDVVVECAT